MTRKQILWHTWEPGLDGNHLTSGGGGLWTLHLFNQFEKAGYDISWFSHNAQPIDRKSWRPAMLSSHKLNAAVFCWRWKFENTEHFHTRNIAYQRQWDLMHYCVEHGVPFLVHDQDLKMTVEDRVWVRTHGGIIATPSFYPDVGELQLHYPSPYTFNLYSPKVNHLTYIGNNYERMEQTIRMLHNFSMFERTILYGNWLEQSLERASPKDVREVLPFVTFGGRLPQTKVLDVLSTSKATIMLHKPEYGDRGFTTIRWAEAAASGTLPFIPYEFKLPLEWQNPLKDLIVEDGDDLERKYNSFKTDAQYWTTIEVFRTFVKSFATHHKWIETIQGLSI